MRRAGSETAATRSGRGLRATGGAVAAAAAVLAWAAPAAVHAAAPALPASVPLGQDAWRVGLLVANNRGSGALPPLRYAERDAGELGEVLIQLGGFRGDDVHLVRGGSLRDVEQKVAQLRTAVAAERAKGRRVVLLFYFSGHSDGEALEIGDDRWPYADVRQTLKEIGADIRVAIVDACQSGALLAAKDGTPGPGFNIRFTDDLASTGEALLTSSAAHETALESREIHASFFSHHLISGLRGAADSSGDGRVTLGEAYRWAFVNTLLSTSRTLNGPQHPGYEYQLAGRGEVVLTDLLGHGARLALPRGFDRILVADERRSVVAELTSASAPLLALSAGRYAVHARRGVRAYETVVQLADGERRDVAFADFTPAPSVTAWQAKGGGGGDGPEASAMATAALPRPSSGTPAAIDAGAGAGVIHGAADALPWLAAVRIEASFFGASRTSGLALQLDLGSARGGGFRETAARLGAGLFVARRWGRVGAQAGWRLSAGPVVQDLDRGERFWTLGAGTGPWARVSLALGWRLALTAAAGVDGVLLRRDGTIESALWPSAMAGLALQL